MVPECERGLCQKNEEVLRQTEACNLSKSFLAPYLKPKLLPIHVDALKASRDTTLTTAIYFATEPSTGFNGEALTSLTVHA